MNAPWFRFYHEVLDDPKVQKLPPETFRIWVNMLCLACRNDGFIPPLSDVSFAFRVTPEIAKEFVSNLIELGLLDRSKNGSIRPHQWDSRQFKSDSSTERVKRFRKRFKTVSVTANETDQRQSRTENTPIVPKGTSEYTPAFEEFWKAYPRPVGKGAAFKAWTRAKLNPDLAQQLHASLTIQRKSEQWTRNNGQFIPHPATWLNQRRWEDETRKPEERRASERSVHDYL